MVNGALNTILTANPYNLILSNNVEYKEEVTLHPNLVKARELYDRVMVDANATSILSCEDLHEISDKLNAEKQILKDHRTVFCVCSSRLRELEIGICTSRVFKKCFHIWKQLSKFVYQVCFLFTEDTTARISF